MLISLFPAIAQRFMITTIIFQIIKSGAIINPTIQPIIGTMNNSETKNSKSSKLNSDFDIS